MPPPKIDCDWVPPTLITNGSYIKDILAAEAGSKVVAHGWVKTRRDGKGVTFLQLQDGSSPTDLQVVITYDAMF